MVAGATSGLAMDEDCGVCGSTSVSDVDIGGMQNPYCDANRDQFISPVNTGDPEQAAAERLVPARFFSCIFIRILT
jgi:hypothetical protein